MARKFKRQRISILGIVLLVGVGGILYGYDIGVISGALFFIQRTISMNDTELGLIVGVMLGGSLVGSLLAGPLADHWGRRPVIRLSTIVFIVGVLSTLLARNFQMLFFARGLLGVGMGIIAVGVPLYVAELTPAEERGKYVTFFQLFLTLGIVAAYFVDLLFTPSGNWHAMFAMVLVPAMILLLGVGYLPESPRWLVAHGHSEQALAVLSSTRTKANAESDLINIHNSLSEVQLQLRDFFSKPIALPLFITLSMSILNQLTGVYTFLQYAPEILINAGLGSDFVSMLGSVGIGLINFFCTVCAAFLIDRVGRRPLLIFGIVGVVLSEIFLATVNMLHLSPHQDGVLSLVGLLGFIFSFAIGPGVVVWLTISELLPTQIRGKGVATCMFFNSLAAALLASSFPDLRDAVGVAGTYWLCAFFSFLYLLLAIFLLPETKEKSLEQITRYFQRNQDEI